MIFTLDTQFFTLTFDRQGPDNVLVTVVPKAAQIGPATSGQVVEGLQGLAGTVIAVATTLGKFDLQP